MTIINTSRKLEDNPVTNIDQNRLDDITSRQILLRYLQEERSKTLSWNTETKAWRTLSFTIDVSGYRWLKRSKTTTSPDPWDKLCFICNHVKCQGDTKRFRIESSYFWRKLAMYGKKTCTTITAWTST